MSPLNPVSPPLGLFPPFCSRESITLKMRERGLLQGISTGDDFGIKDIHGRPICMCKGKVAKLGCRKVFADTNGFVLFALKDKKCALSKSFRGVGVNGEKLFQVKGHWSPFGSKSSIHFTNTSDKQAVKLKLKGDWLDRAATVNFQGRLVAQIERSFTNVGETFSDMQTYYVTVAPGVDLVLMAAICVCLDERENDQPK